jgi:RNA polymerase sigma factor (TIGR02999 family)
MDVLETERLTQRAASKYLCSMPDGANMPDLIASAQQGDARAVDALFAEAYRELRKLARIRLRAGGRATPLNTTTLVHESYLRLAGAEGLQINDRAHFMGYAARAMRSVIVDLARKRQSARHGGQAAPLALDTELASNISVNETEILGIHEALDELERLDPRMARIVEMRYFAGMTETEIGEALALTDRTVRREWEKARLWLSVALRK